MSLKHKVLLVDDEPAILKVFGMKLKVSGFEVSTALNGREALQMIKSEKPDILLLDLIMPIMDGFEVLQELRCFSKLPVIVISAKPESYQRVLSLGANDFLAKPFNAEELLKKIRELLDHKKINP
jgi:DNA-binding response OmpR family regulator